MQTPMPAEPQPATCKVQPATLPTVIVAEPVTDHAASSSNIENLLNNGSFRVKEERALIQRRTVESVSDSQPATCNLQPATIHGVISAPPTASAHLTERMRNGKIARLPKLERDMVNKLLHNHIPYSKIVWALEQRGINVTERNVSNWKTRGGYKEWCAEQENQLRLSHIQDHLTDYLRKHDSQQLPEVGLQVASTQLTSLLMNPTTAAPLLADPDKMAKIVDSLDKCSARLAELQKERYENARRASNKGTVQNFRCEESKDVEVLQEIASAAKLAMSSREETIRHRNDLPPREVIPYRPPGPTIGDILRLQAEERAKAKKSSETPSNDVSTTGPGNRTVTE